LAKIARERPLTLLTSTRELDLSHATVLREMILRSAGRVAPAKKRRARKGGG